MDDGSFEPFTPSSYRTGAEFKEGVEDHGVYYVVVYHDEIGGNYGLVVGYRERFTVFEWIKLPIDVVRIRRWEGQPISLIFAPLIVTIGVGAIHTYLRKKDELPENLSGWMLLTSSYLYLGTGALFLTQIGIASMGSSPGPAVMVSFILAAIPLLLGYNLWRYSFTSTDLDQIDRLKIILYGVLGLFFWAGMIIGPVLALVSSLSPSD